MVSSMEIDDNMKQILVIYFTQSGQLRTAIDATLAPLETSGRFKITYQQLEPVKPFPFPWGYMAFFSAFANTVMGRPQPIHPIPTEPLERADLVILAYQPWFLSVSQPLQACLLQEPVRKALMGKPIVTIVACRNMWINAQEKLKLTLKEIGAELKGHIAYVDESPNLISMITVMAYVLGGIRGRFLKIFPLYGVAAEVLKTKAPRFGAILAKHIEDGDFDQLQSHLLAEGAVKVKPNLMIMEGRGRILFPLYARFITKDGKATEAQQRMRVRIFGIVLPLLITILSPIIGLIAKLLPYIHPEKINRKIRYYENVSCH